MEKPILFKTPMVQAIKDGRKDVTRRCNGLHEINEKPKDWGVLNILDGCTWFYSNNGIIKVKHPYGPAGTILWVRETYRYSNTPNPEVLNYQFKDGIKGPYIPEDECYKISDYERWRPSIHMPKSAAMIWLKIISTRAERLFDITEEDCIREGILGMKCPIEKNRMIYKDYLQVEMTAKNSLRPKPSFKSLWISINGQESWDSNPWVFRVEFEVLSTNGKPSGL